MTANAYFKLPKVLRRLYEGPLGHQSCLKTAPSNSMLPACKLVIETSQGNATVKPSARPMAAPGAETTRVNPVTACSCSRESSVGGQLLAPVKKLMVNQRLLLAVSAAGHAGDLPLSNMLLPDVRSFGWGHADSSWNGGGRQCVQSASRNVGADLLALTLRHCIANKLTVH